MRSTPLRGQSYFAGNIGIGTSSPATLLHLSSGTLTVDGNTGGISVTAPSGITSTYGITAGSVNVNGQNYSWPGSQGNGVLTNNGSGSLSWAAAGAGQYILNQNSIQPGSTFYVSSGTVAGNLSVGGVLSATGTVNLGSALNAVTISSNAVLSGALVANASAGTSGQILQSQGPGTTPTWVSASNSSLLSSTNTWTAGQTYISSVTFSSMVVAGNGPGTVGQVLQTGITGAPTWVSVPGASTLLATTNTWTAGQTFISSVTFSSTVVAGNGAGTAGQVLQSGGAGAAPTWVTSSIASGSTNYIQNTSSLQNGATFYVSSGTVAGTSPLERPVRSTSSAPRSASGRQALLRPSILNRVI